MGNSKNVYKTIKSEAAKLSLLDKDLVANVMKLKGFYEKQFNRQNHKRIHTKLQCRSFFNLLVDPVRY